METEASDTRWMSNFMMKTQVAEGEGFEPPEACASTVFKTAAIDHSATPPKEPTSFFDDDGWNQTEKTRNDVHYIQLRHPNSSDFVHSRDSKIAPDEH